MCSPERRPRRRHALPFLAAVLAAGLAVAASAPVAAQEATKGVSLEVVLLDAVEGDANGKPEMDKLAQNVKALLEKTKEYKSFATKDYDLDNADLNKAFALQLKKKIAGMKVEITPTASANKEVALTVEWKQDDKVLIRQSTKIKDGKWYMAAHPREDGNVWLLMIKPGEPIGDLKAERKKRGLPEEKKKEEETEK